jgi:hypothetical protein
MSVVEIQRAVEDEGNNALYGLDRTQVRAYDSGRGKHFRYDGRQKNFPHVLRRVYQTLVPINPFQFQYQAPYERLVEYLQSVRCVIRQIVLIGTSDAEDLK